MKSIKHFVLRVGQYLNLENVMMSVVVDDGVTMEYPSAWLRMETQHGEFELCAVAVTMPKVVFDLDENDWQLPTIEEGEDDTTEVEVPRPSPSTPRVRTLPVHLLRYMTNEQVLHALNN